MKERIVQMIKKYTAPELQWNKTYSATRHTADLVLVYGVNIMSYMEKVSDLSCETTLPVMTHKLTVVYEDLLEMILQHTLFIQLSAVPLLKLICKRRLTFQKLSVHWVFRSPLQTHKTKLITRRGIKPCRCVGSNTAKRVLHFWGINPTIMQVFNTFLLLNCRFFKHWVKIFF